MYAYTPSFAVTIITILTKLSKHLLANIIKKSSSPDVIGYT